MAKRLVDFRSDNVASVSPAILDALVAANAGTAASYGEDEQSRLLNENFSRLFEREVHVFPVSTGTAANALSLSVLTPPYGVVFCYEEAHIHTSEANAAEFFCGGAKLRLLGGEGYRIQAKILEQAIKTAGVGVKNRPQPAAISVTQATEYGTVYRLEELHEIGQVARAAKLRFHMDGARFANAVAKLGCSPADMTWRAGVDILSFGATKNGAMNTEAIVVFNEGLVEDLSFRLRRAGQTWSKMRFSAVQLNTYVTDGHFLHLATRANTLAARIAEKVASLPSVHFVAPVEANEVFLELAPDLVDRLIEDGFLFFRRSASRIRLVCRFDGTDEEADLFVAALRSPPSAKRA